MFKWRFYDDEKNELNPGTLNGTETQRLACHKNSPIG